MSVLFKKKAYKAKRKKGRLTLNLSGKKITHISSIESLEDLHDLEVLNLSNNSISEIEGLETLRNLKVLILANNSITEIKNLVNLTNLELLILNKNPIYILKGLDTLENLKEIDFFKCKISEIESFSNKQSLEKMFLGKNPIYADLYKVVSKRKKLRKMTEEQRNRKGVNPKLWQIAENTHFKLKYKPEQGSGAGAYLAVSGAEGLLECLQCFTVVIFIIISTSLSKFLLP
ncbi:MAG: hypothetical protein EAX91_04605 [Candidatus Lokiarchaeota archaeon]|nr:hypothetical protein [Candidatus Lokiarchaeota archaeon]